MMTHFKMNDSGLVFGGQFEYTISTFGVETLV